MDAIHVLSKYLLNCFVRATAVNEMEPQTQERDLSN